MKLRLVKIVTIVAYCLTFSTNNLRAMKKVIEKVGLRKSETHDARLTRKMDEFERAEQRLKSARDAAASSGTRTSSDVKRAYEEVQKTSRDLRGAISNVEKRGGLRDEHVERLSDFGRRLEKKQIRRTDEGKNEPLTYQEELTLKKLQKTTPRTATGETLIEAKPSPTTPAKIEEFTSMKSAKELERERAALAKGKLTSKHKDEIKSLQLSPKRADQIIEEKLTTPEGQKELAQLKNKMATHIDKALEKNKDISGKDLTVLKQEKDALQDKFLKAVNDAPNALEKQILLSMQVKGSKLDLLEQAIQKEKNKLSSNPTDEKTQKTLDRLHYEYGFVANDQKNLTQRLFEVSGKEKAKDISDTLELLKTKAAQARNLEAAASRPESSAQPSNIETVEKAQQPWMKVIKTDSDKGDLSIGRRIASSKTASTDDTPPPLPSRRAKASEVIDEEKAAPSGFAAQLSTQAEKLKKPEISVPPKQSDELSDVRAQALEKRRNIIAPSKQEKARQKIEEEAFWDAPAQ